MNKLLFFSAMLSIFVLKINAQTISWAGFPNGGTTFTSGIMTATVTSTNPGFQYGTPRFIAGTSNGGGFCSFANSLELEQNFGNITTANVTLTLDFTSGGTTNGLCGSISFQIKDINADESFQGFSDWVEVSAVNGLNAPIAVGAITATGGSNKTISANGNTRIVVGHSNAPYGSRSSTACDNVTFTVTPSAGTTLKTVTIIYHPEYTTAPNDYYSFSNPKRPAYQYISISPISITASSGPTAVQVSTNPASCTQNDGTVTIGNVTGGTAPYQYNFNTLGLGSTTSFADLSPGTYPVLVQDSNGCTVSTNVTVGLSSGPTAIAITSSPETCSQSNGTINIGTVTGGTAPFQYNLNNQGYSNTTSYSNLVGGTYSLTVQDNAGCTYSTSVTIASFFSPTSIASTISPASCSQINGSITLGNVTSGTAPFQYNFNNLGFSSTTNFNNLSAGDYTLIVKDANNCIYTTILTVTTSIAGPTAVQSNTTADFCNQSNGTLIIGDVTGGIAPYTFNFNNTSFSSNLNYSNLSAGNYYLIVKDNNGCTYETTLTISGTSGPSAILTNTSPEICGQGNAILTLGTITGGTAPYQYNFNSLGFETTFNYSDLSAGNYSLIVKDVNGCEFFTTVVITNLSGPSLVNFLTISTTCNSNNGAISILNVVNGTTPYTYNLNSVGFSSNTNFPFLTAGNYFLEVKDANGCLLDTIISITASPDGILDATLNIDSPTCIETTGSLEIVSINSGVLPYSFSVDGSTAQSSNVFQNLSVGNHSIVIEDAQGCGIYYEFEILAPSIETALKIPNVFTPNSDAINAKWFVEGTCVEEIECIIFNRWGNEMAKMKGQSVEWDGISNEKAVNAGVYFYKLKVKSNDGEIKNYHGHITVIY